MKPLHVGAAVLNQTPLDWDGNKRRIAGALADARRAGIAMLCLPELSISGYGCEDAFLSLGTLRQSERVLGELLPETRGLVATFGLPVLYRNALFNCAALAVDGRLLGVVPKRFLAGDGLHYEPRWFKPWEAGRRSVVELCGAPLPIGDLLFDVGGIRIGFEICEDAWVAGRPGAAFAAEGVDVILNPSASHFAFGKLDVRKGFVLEGSRAFGVAYVYTNLVGNEAGRAIYDGGALIASRGKLLAEGRRFGFDEWSLTSALIDVDVARSTQARIASFRPEFEDAEGRNVRIPHSWPESPGSVPRPAVPEWERGTFRKEEEFARAEALALFDYLRKSRSEGFVVSLSGGADSAAVACLVAISLRLALAELGPAQLADRLSYVRGLGAEAGERSLVSRLLVTAYQPTSSSSETTRLAAAAVADAIGSRHSVIDVQPIVELYRERAEASLGRKLTWESDDIALQNIQSRVRGPSVWMLANVGRSLLLATSNRSEAAAGYATMDGDTCGGLSPIAGIDKAFLRHWLAWLETLGPEGIGPIPELSAVTAQRSSAELRPQEAHQTTEEDLMPFPVLDAIERLAIRDKLPPLDVWDRMRRADPDADAARLARQVERFFVLWARNQWKRERYAPSFHLDDENLDPKTWCRFPILSGGFERELEELRVAVERAVPDRAPLG